ncbi:MAG: hypothetical protein MUD14_22290 [Hydrococcus sp. Prado102]|jgi:hypothetical protein|nr:hypothetical protein [Hydrococcus sp. Prado102]
MLKKLSNGFLIAIGYLLSPLCWWNDLFFNLPIAYFFGKLCGLFSQSFFVTGAIAGYWLSNIVGILLMQFGTLALLKNQSEPQPHNLKKELLMGFVSSTAYTLAILALIHFKILDTPLLASIISDGSGKIN